MVGIKQDFDDVKMEQIEDMDKFIRNKPNHIRCIQLKPGLKIYYSNKEQCLKTSEELTNAGFKNRVAYNCDGNFWSIYVLDKKSLMNDYEENFDN